MTTSGDVHEPAPDRRPRLDRRPRIAVLSQQYGTVGGQELFAREVTERLARTGRYAMHVFARTWRSDCPEIVFHRVPLWGVPRQLTPTVFSWLACRMARRMGCDLLHAHSRCTDADLYSVHWCPHGFWTREILRRTPRWSDRLRIRIDAGMVARGAGRVFMPVSALQQEVFEAQHGRLPGTWTVVSPGVDTERFHPARLAHVRESTRTQLGFGPSDRVVLFVGMNWESKGLERLVRAIGLARVRTGSENIRLLVVGKGDERSHRALAQSVGCADSVVFVGERRSGMECFFASADLFAMPADFETFSMATLEALASGLPAIVSDRMGVRDLVLAPGAVLVHPVRPEPLADALLFAARACGEYDDRMSRADQCRDMGWSYRAEQIARQYDRLLSRDPASRSSRA